MNDKVPSHMWRARAAQLNRWGASMGLLKVPYLLLAAAVLSPNIASAVCLDPKTWISGYHIPLKEEIKTSVAIIIGKVVEEHEIHDEPSDPESFSATTYKVIVERTLKGRISTVVTLWTPNDSSRYAMSKGERHILFLTASRDQNSNHYEADGCGSSTPLPVGQAAV